MALSKKDKNLIYGCALFATASLTYMFALSPMSENIELLTSERDTAEAFLDNVNYDASMGGTYVTWLGETRTDYLKDREFFEDVYATENADKLFTDEVLSYNMLPLNFSISDRDYIERLEPYDFEIDEEYVEEGEEGFFPYSLYIYKRIVMFDCRGSFENALNYVNELKERNGMIIRDVSFIPDRMEDDGIVDFKNEQMLVNLSVEFEIYTYDKDLFADESGIDFDRLIGDYYDRKDEEQAEDTADGISEEPLEEAPDETPDEDMNEFSDGIADENIEADIADITE